MGEANRKKYRHYTFEMDSPKTPISDPSILLLNEIEILLAQSRLLELYVKQSQATATYEAARAHEQHQAELAGLRSALAEKEQILAVNQSALGAREQHLQQRVQDLEVDLGEAQRRLERRDAGFTSLESEATDLRGRIGQLEAAQVQAQTLARQAASVRQELEAELANLHKGLEENQQSFQKQQLASRKIHDDLQTEIAQLREQLSERLAWSRNAESGLQASGREIDDLRQRVAELQTSRQEAQASAARELEETRTRLETELDRLQTVLAEREHALKENQRVMVEIERQVKTEILTLRSQLDQKQELIEFRDEELRAAQTQAAALQQRVAEVEAARQLAIVNADEIEGVRRSYESQLEALQHEVAMRERALTERQEAVSAVELALHGKIQSLQQELARSRNLIEERESAVQSSRAQTEALRERIGQQESAAAADLQARQFAEETRRGLEAENSHLHATLAQKEFALDEQAKTLTSLQQRSSVEINELRCQLEQQQAVADGGGAELARLRSEITALAEQKTELENSRHALERSRQQDALTRQDLEARLQAKEEELRAVQTNAQELTQSALRAQELRYKSLEEQWECEIAQLRDQLHEQEIAAQQGHSESAQFRSELVVLREQKAQLEHSRDELEQYRQQASVQREELETRLRAEDELKVAWVHANEQKAAALEAQDAQFKAIEDKLSSEIRQLRNQLEQRQKTTEQANEELARLRSENAGIQEQKAQAELLREEFEQNRQQDAALRQELEARLQAREEELRTVQTNAQELVQVALREQEVQFKWLEEQTSSDIVRLRNQSQEQELAAQQGRFELAQLRAEIVGLLEQNTQSQHSRDELNQKLQRAAGLCKELESRLKAKEDELGSAQARASERLAAALRERETHFNSIAEERRNEINDLRSQLDGQRNSAERVHEELVQLRSENVGIQGQNAQAEHFRRELEQNWHQANELRQELETRLQAKNAELQAAQSGANTLKNQLDAKINDLQLHLAEEHLLVQSRAAETKNLEVQVVRLSEQLTQRDSASAESQARFQKEAELGRAEHQAAITALRDEYQIKQRAQENERAQERQRVADLNHQISEFERRNSQAETQLKDRQQELEVVSVEATALRSRLNELETQRHTELSTAEQEKDQIRIKFDAEVAAARHELQQKAWALAQQQATLENLALTHKDQIQKLEDKIAEQQNSVANRNLDIEKSQSQARLLERRVEELITELQQAELTSINRAVQIKEEYGLRIADLDRQVAQKTSELLERGASGSELEQTLRQEIDRLIREAQEKNQILQDRNDEVVRVKSETDALLERFSQMESSASEAESAFTAESERMRIEFQAQLALFQAELSQKEWALEEAQAAARGLEQTYRQEIGSLRRQLEETEARAQEDKDKYVLGEGKLTDEQQKRYEKYKQVMDVVISATNPSFPVTENRRWRSQFGWKRRWKS